MNIIPEFCGAKYPESKNKSMKDFFKITKIHFIVLGASILWGIFTAFLDSVLHSGFSNYIFDIIIYPGNLVLNFWSSKMWPILHPDVYAKCQMWRASFSPGFGCFLEDLPKGWEAVVVITVIIICEVIWLYLWTCLIRYLFKIILNRECPV